LLCDEQTEAYGALRAQHGNFHAMLLGIGCCC